MGLNNIFRYKTKNVETLDSILHAATISVRFNAKMKFIRMTSISANRLYLLFATITFFFPLENRRTGRAQVIVVHRESRRRAATTTTTTTIMTTMTWGTRASGVSPRWDQVFLAVATRLSASGPRSRSRPTKTSCQKSRYVNAPRKPGLDRAAVFCWSQVYTG